jgi:protocatechuate 3,4-dioxygenase beta subunit
LSAFHRGGLTLAAAGVTKMKTIASLRFSSLTLLVFLTISPITSPGQDLDNLTISGRIMDQNGAAVPGAAVSAVLTQVGSSRSTVTDSSGNYRFVQLRPGNFRTMDLRRRK